MRFLQFVLIFTFIVNPYSFFLENAYALKQSNESATQNLGLSSMSSCSGMRRTGLAWPGITGGVPTIINGKLIIGDSVNHRLLVWNNWPTQNNQESDLHLGQVTKCTNIAHSYIPGLNKPNLFTWSAGTFYDGSHFFYADEDGNRVLIWDHVPTSLTDLPNLVLGQANFTDGAINRGQPNPSANTLYYPANVVSDGNKVIVTDRLNHRVLIWNNFPTTNGQSADVVLGQPDFNTNVLHNGGVSASNFGDPVGVVYKSNRLFISDRAGNRILIWNTLPTVNNTNSDIVLGQPDFSSSTANNGGVSAHSMSNNTTAGLFSDGTKLYFSDGNNSRVLIWNSLPTIINQDADVVVGQADFISNGQNQNGNPAANTLKLPGSVASDGQKMVIVDHHNFRVLLYNTVPTTNNASADVVLGQPDFTTRFVNAYTPSGNSLEAPRDMITIGSKFVIADSDNNRVLIWNSFPANNSIPADVVIGQPDMSSKSANNGGLTDKSLNNPRSISTDGSKLFIADTGNHRILIYNTIPSSSYASADLVLGQTLFTTGTANLGGLSASSLNSPRAVFVSGTKLLVSDFSNNRVLIWNAIPTTNNEVSNVVIGQPDLVSNTANNGGASAKSIYGPVGILTVGGKLFVSDSWNHRVLVYNTIPSSSYTSADLVIGQPDFTNISINQGGNASSSSMKYPEYISTDGERLFLADSWNHRVLIWNMLPSVNNKMADVVIGQENFINGEANKNYNTSASSLAIPIDIITYQDKLYISDSANNRIMIYELYPHGTISVPSHTNSNIVNATFGGSDVKEMMVSEDPNFIGASWETYTATKTITLSSGTGQKTIYVKFRDYGNYEKVLSAQSVVDIVAPTGSIIVNSNEVTTNSQNVTLTLTVSDNLAGVEQMMISNNADFSGAVWETYSATKSWTLTSGSGTKTVYVKYKDRAGNVSGVYTDTVDYNSLPAVGLVLVSYVTFNILFSVFVLAFVLLVFFVRDRNKYETKEE